MLSPPCKAGRGGGGSSVCNAIEYRSSYPGRWLVPGGAVLFIIVIVAGMRDGRWQQVGAEAKDKSPAKPPAAGQPADAPKLPPLELDEDEPLRLDAPGRSAVAEKSKPTAENAACFVCHANFRKEELATSHAANGVGCASCHGPSLAHRNDEANIIPPDTMFAADRIDASCARCHDSHDVEPREVVARFLAKSPGNSDPKSLVCTSCHGEHRLSVRTVHWDKKSGKLLARKK